MTGARRLLSWSFDITILVLGKVETGIMSTNISSTDEKNIMPNTHLDVESNDEKAAQGAALQEATYDHQGTEVERALIFKQDLRIIPLCSVSLCNDI